MKKTKYPLLTRLEVINKKKIIIGFNGGDLYERKDNHSQFGWADKWEDIHNTLKVVYPLLVNLSNDQNRKKITDLDWGIYYTVPDIDQIKDLKKNKKYKKLKKNYHGYPIISFHKKVLHIAADLFTESSIWKNGEFGLGVYSIKLVANLIDDLKEIYFTHQPLEAGWLKKTKYQENYIRFKLKNWSWIDGSIDIYNKSFRNKNFLLDKVKTSGDERFVTRYSARSLINNKVKSLIIKKKRTKKLIDLENKSVGENIVDVVKQSYKKEMKGKDYGKDKDALVYLRKNINKKVKFNFSRLFGTTDEHKKNKVILKKYKIIK